jgi:hypothetical protein
MSGIICRPSSRMGKFQISRIPETSQWNQLTAPLDDGRKYFACDSLF